MLDELLFIVLLLQVLLLLVVIVGVAAVLAVGKNYKFNLPILSVLWTMLLVQMVLPAFDVAWRNSSSR